MLFLRFNSLTWYIPVILIQYFAPATCEQLFRNDKLTSRSGSQSSVQVKSSNESHSKQRIDFVDGINDSKRQRLIIVIWYVIEKDILTFIFVSMLIIFLFISVDCFWPLLLPNTNVGLNSVTRSSNTQVKCKLTQTAFSWKMKKDNT